MTSDSTFWIEYLAIYAGIGAMSFYARDFKTAEEYLNKCLNLNEQRFGTYNYIYRIAITKLGHMARHKGNFEKYVKCIEQAMFNTEPYLDSLDMYRGHSYTNMAGYYHQIGEYEKAQLYDLKAFKIYESLYKLYLVRADPEIMELLHRYTHTTNTPEKFRNALLTNIPGTYINSCINNARLNIQQGNMLNAEYLMGQANSVLTDNDVPEIWERRYKVKIEMGKVGILHNQKAYQKSLNLCDQILRTYDLEITDKINVLFQTVDLNLHLKQYEEVITTINNLFFLINMQPAQYNTGHSSLYANLGIAHTYLNNPDSAQTYFKESLNSLNIKGIENLDSAIISHAISSSSSLMMYELLRILFLITEAEGYKCSQVPTVENHQKIIKLTKHIDQICQQIVDQYEYNESIFRLVEILHTIYELGINSASYIFSTTKDPQYGELMVLWSDHCKATILRLKNHKQSLVVDSYHSNPYDMLNQLNFRRNLHRHKLFEAKEQADIDSVFLRNVSNEELDLTRKIDSLSKKLDKSQLGQKKHTLKEYLSFTKNKNITLLDYFHGKNKLFIQCIN